MNEVRQWLTILGLERFADAFEREEVVFDQLPELTDTDLKDLGLPLGPRKTVLKAAAEVRNSSATASVELGPEPITGQSTSSGERRQLTVMFCDLVGSTALSEKLDPEELRSLLHDYRTRCGEVISHYEGFVARYVGDGILTYFGWPTAHEDGAERSIRAALAITQTIKRASLTETLSVRIGIATGPVVVGAQAGEGSEAKLAVGSTPNLAARLQGLASTDQIVVAASTRRLIGNAFELADLGEHQLKGISEPVHAWQVVAVSEAANRFDASHGERLTPLVGREQEIGLLMDRWQLAREGEGQVVLLAGEPGIGKSRSLSALRERLEAQGAQALRFQCSPYYINSAFWPSIDNFERALKFKRDETPESKLDKLEALMVNEYNRPIADVRFIASMLSIPCEERYGALAMTPQKHKDETLRTLVDLTEAAARKQPSMMLYEDLHWADPTSLEVLELLIDRVRTIPLLIVLTHRPEFQSRWSQHGHVTALNLSKLTRNQSAAMVSKLANGKALPGDLLEQILAKTDGVPLYVEELTKSIIESGELKEMGDRYEYAGTTHHITIPATLRDSLMARLDRSPAAREIAQIGAAIGREFRYELIAAVAPMNETHLAVALAQLTESGLAYRRGSPPDAVYTFKHALVQDAAYDSLLKTKRQELHAQIAEAIEERFPNTKETEPEVLAHHYTEGGKFQNAVHNWRLAADRANARFATSEAIAHAKKGLVIITRLAEDPERINQELALRINLIVSLRMADRLNEALEELDQAERLAAQSQRILELARIHHLRGNIYFPLGKIEQCLAEQETSLRFARNAHSAEDEARAEGGLCDAYYMRGWMRSSHEHVEHCVDMCRAHDLSAIEIAYLPMRATTHMYALRFTEALKDCKSVSDKAEKLGQPRAEIIALNTRIFILLDQHEFDQAEEASRRATELMERIGARRFIPLCNHGIALARLNRGDHQGALALLETSLKVARETGITFWGPLILGVVAMASSDMGHRYEALREGKALLDLGCVSHNYFWFYRDAIEASLEDERWDLVDSYATALEYYFREQPIAWPSFIVARGRALADVGRGGRSEATRSQIKRLRDEAAGLGMRRELQRLAAVFESQLI